MPIEDGDYEQRDETEINSSLENEARNRFGDDIDLTEDSVFSTIIGSLATVLANNQEESLDAIYDSAYLDTATGEDLDNVVSIVGIKRRSATQATGVQRFTSDSVPNSSETVSRDTRVSTGGDNSVKFQSTESGKIERIDDFSDNDISEYSGDEGDFTTENVSNFSSNTNLNDNYILKTSGSDSSIRRADKRVRQGNRLVTAFEIPSGVEVENHFLIDDADNYVRTVLDEGSGEHRIEVITSSTVGTDASNSVSVTSGDVYKNEVRLTTQNEIVSILYDSNDDEVDRLTLDEGDSPTYEIGGVGFGVGTNGSSNTVRWVGVGTRETVVNIEAVNGGSSGNVGANSLTTSPTPPSGFDSWTNPYPCGDDSFVNTENRSFNVGLPEETDTQLRERTRRTLTAGGTATVDAILGSVINDVDGVQSVTLLENDTGFPAVPPNGSLQLPEYSFELVVQGGADDDIAEAVFDSMAVTSRDVNDIHGVPPSTANSGGDFDKAVVVTSDINGEDYGIRYSRPKPVFTDIEIDLIVTDEYVGDDEIKDQIVQYIGGFNTSDVEILGTDVEEDIYIDKIEDIVVGDENGVRGVPKETAGDSVKAITITGYYDDGGTQTVSITTDSEDLERLSVDTGQVAVTDANGGNLDMSNVSQSSVNITVNTTQV